jgi:hypothetical protein
MDEIAEFTGRLYGQAKSVFSKGAKTTTDETEKVAVEATKIKDEAAQGWAKGEEEGRLDMQSKTTTDPTTATGTTTGTTSRVSAEAGKIKEEAVEGWAKGKEQGHQDVENRR